MFELKGIRKIFSNGKSATIALDDVNLTLPQKGMVFVVGKSGSGKSTLLNLIAGLDKPTKGEILFHNKNVAAFKEKELDEYHYSQIGFVFQNYCLLDDATVEANIAMGLKEGPKRIRGPIKDALKSVGLSPNIAKKKVKHLSGGQKQRVAIARALIKDPPILLCDEPTGNLDRGSSEEVMKILKRRSSSSFVLVVSHNLPEAYRFADRIITLEKGKIVSDLTHIPTSQEESGAVYLSNPDEMGVDQLDALNAKITNGQIKKILPRKALFQPTKEQAEDEKTSERKIPGHFFAPIPNVMRAMNRSKWRLALFPILTGILLSLFSCMDSLYRFDAQKFAASSFEKGERADFILQKGREGKSGSVDTNRIFPVEKKELEALASSSYTGKSCPLYALPITLRGASWDRLTADYSLTVSTAFTSFYSNQSQGLLVTDEPFLKKHLGVDELVYRAKADTELPTGIYITDYFADAILSRSTTLTSDADFVGKQAQLGNQLNYTYYVNGIIQTNYKTRLASLKEAMNQANGDSTVLLKSQYQDDVDYLTNALNVAYSFNPNFMADLRSDLKSYPRFTITPRIAGDNIGAKMSAAYCYPVSLLKKGELLLSPAMMDSLFHITSDTEAKAKVAELNEKGGLSLQFQVASQDMTENVRFQNAMSISRLRLTSEFKTAALNAEGFPYSSTLGLSVEDYVELREGRAYPYALCFDTPKEFALANSALSPYHFVAKSVAYDTVSQVGSGIFVFSQAFQLLSALSAMGSVVLLVLFAVSLMKSQKYNAGVWKALGYRGIELTIYFTLETLLFVLLSAVWFGVGYALVSKMLNRVLTQALFRTGEAQFVIPILSFSWDNFLLGIAFSLGTVLLLVFAFLISIRKAKAIDVIQNKE